MDCINNIKNIRNPRLSRKSSIYGGVSLVIIDSPSRHMCPDDKNLHLSFVNYCFVLCHTEVSQCLNYFKKASLRDHVIVLINSSDEHKIQNIISQLEKCQQLQAIFILYSTDNEDEARSKMPNSDGSKYLYGNSTKKIETFYERELLLTSLQEFIIGTEHSLKDDGLFTICNTPEKALRDLGRELGSFVWTHTFRVLLVDMPHNSLEAKRQMLRECRKICGSCRFELNQIAVFEKTYRPCDAIRWYTKPCFLSSLVNKALRSANVHALYTFRYFIFDLCESLSIARCTHSTPISAYRGTILRRDEVEQLHMDSLVSTNGFLSSSSNLQVALMFADANQGTDTPTRRSRNDEQQFVLFKIDIDPNVSPDVVVANISGESQIPDEDELLFDLGTTFVITNTIYDDENYIWRIQMTSSNRVAQLNRNYDSYIRERLSETNATILFGRMLAHLSEYSLATKYFHRLLRVLPMGHEDRPGIHYQLARMYRFLGKHQQSMHYFRCAKLLQRRGLPQNKYEYGMTLAGIGTLHLELNDSKRAVCVLELASICYNILSKNYNTETAFHFNRLSYAYYLEHQYERALLILNDTLIIYKKKMPVDHPGHAQAYHNLGLVHRAMGNSDQAIISFKEALRMREALLAPNHPYLARTCYQMGLLYEEREEHSFALEYARKAHIIQQLKLPSKNQEREDSAELVTRLSAKNNITM